MNKELSRAIMKRSQLRNKYNKNKTDINWENFRKQRNKCTAIKLRVKADYLKKETENPNPQNSKFWKIISPYISDKGHHNDESLMLLENNEIIKRKEQVASIFNQFFVNIVEHTTNIKPETFQFTGNNDSIDQIINYYKNHMSPKLIREQIQENERENFELKLCNEEEIESIILKLNSEAASGFDKISPKILKLSCNQMKKTTLCSN